MIDISTHMDVALPSHHFLVICAIHIDIPIRPRQPKNKLDYSALRDVRLTNSFTKHLLHHLPETHLFED